MTESKIRLVKTKSDTLDVLLHGAGGGMEHQNMKKAFDVCVEKGHPVVNFNFPFFDRGEEHWRERLHGEPRRHVYYHCGRVRDPNCKEPFASEEKVLSSLGKYVNFMVTAHPQTLKLSNKTKVGLDIYNKIREEALIQQNVNPNGKTVSFSEYARHILRNGTNEEIKEIALSFGRQLYIHNKEVCGSPIR